MVGFGSFTGADLDSEKIPDAAPLNPDRAVFVRLLTSPARDISKNDLAFSFHFFGQVVSVRILQQRPLKAYVNFADRVSAEEAIAHHDVRVFDEDGLAFTSVEALPHRDAETQALDETSSHERGTANVNDRAAYVYQLEDWVTEELLMSRFGKFGFVESAVRVKGTNIGFVNFDDTDPVHKAVATKKLTIVDPESGRQGEIKIGYHSESTWKKLRMDVGMKPPIGQGHDIPEAKRSFVRCFPVYVRPIPIDWCTEEDLAAAFEVIGPVINASLVRGKNVAFVNFAHEWSANAAIEKGEVIVRSLTERRRVSAVVKIGPYTGSKDQTLIANPTKSSRADNDSNANVAKQSVPFFRTALSRLDNTIPYSSSMASTSANWREHSAKIANWRSEDQKELGHRTVDEQMEEPRCQRSKERFADRWSGVDGWEIDGASVLESKFSIGKKTEAEFDTLRDEDCPANCQEKPAFGGPMQTEPLDVSSTDDCAEADDGSSSDNSLGPQRSRRVSRAHPAPTKTQDSSKRLAMATVAQNKESSKNCFTDLEREVLIKLLNDQGQFYVSELTVPGQPKAIRKNLFKDTQELIPVGDFIRKLKGTKLECGLLAFSLTRINGDYRVKLNPTEPHTAL